MADVHLVVRKMIKTDPERLFKAWTSPSQLKQWWGPKTMYCSDAVVDLRVGGAFRLGHQSRDPQNHDGQTLWIVGEFEKIVVPKLLVYSWRIEGQDSAKERVTVRFEGQKDAAQKITEVIVVHERIAHDAAKEEHRLGWLSCLDGLLALVEIP